MRVLQTADEIGLESGVAVLWSEPRSGQRLKPRFGSRPFPKKAFYAIALLAAYLIFSVASNGAAPGPKELLLLLFVAVAAVFIAWPLMILLDRINRRNVWVYSDRVLVTHARDREIISKSDVKNIYVYRAQEPITIAIEFLTSKGKSLVVGLPEEMKVSDLIQTLSSLGYPVQNDLYPYSREGQPTSCACWCPPRFALRLPLTSTLAA